MKIDTPLQSRILRRSALGAGAAALTLILGAANPAQAASPCRELRGSYTEHAVSADCQSPVALCIAGNYTGQIEGAFFGQATSITTTADTPTTGVAMFTSDSTIIATIGKRHGTLIIKNAGAFAAGNGGPIVDLQTIVAGTDQLAGATGALRASGIFSPTAGGQSRYEGILCLR